MEYSKDNVMTRKEYLKSKNKKHIDYSKLKRPLIVLVIILLSIYVFKQLNVYNKVTKVANAVVEKNALAKTMTMYYVADSYTKDYTKSVMYYKSYDESRTKIENTENMSNIFVQDNVLYGIKDNKIHAVDLATKQIQALTEEEATNYTLYDGFIYYMGKNNEGVYKLDVATQEIQELFKGRVYQIEVCDNYIYVITKGTTKQSIVRYSLNGDDKKVLSSDYVVSYFYVDASKIYFINPNNSKLYMMSKDGKNIKIVANNQVKNSILTFEDKIFYINKSDGNMYKLDHLSNKESKIIDKNVESMQIDKNIIYYKLKDNIGIYKYDILTEKTSQVTSARTSEYICKN